MATWITKYAGEKVAASHINDLQTWKVDKGGTTSGTAGVTTIDIYLPETGYVHDAQYINASFRLNALPGGAENQSYVSLYASAELDGTRATTGNVAGLKATGIVAGSSWANIVQGIEAVAVWTSTSETATQSLYGIRSHIEVLAPGDVAHAMAFKANAPTVSGSPTINHIWGLYIADQEGYSNYSGAIHIEGIGEGNAIGFSGAVSDTANFQIYSSATGIVIAKGAQWISNQGADKNIAFRAQSLIGGLATAAALHAMNDAASGWIPLCIESDALYINPATGGSVAIGVGSIGAGATKTLAIGTGNPPTTMPADAFQIYSADAAGAGTAGFHMMSETGGVFGIYPNYGKVTQYFYQNDALADDGGFDLPAATSGLAFVSCNGEAGMWLVQSDGTATKISGSANTAATDTDGSLCVFDGGTAATVKNRLGAVGEMRIFYFYN